VLWEFRIGSKPFYFCNLGWIRDPKGVIVHRMCTSTMRRYSCGTKSLLRCFRIGVLASRTLRPCGRLRRLHHQCMCEGVIPVFVLLGYIAESPLIITALLLDRSWAIRGCIGNNFFVICTEPQHIYIRTYDKHEARIFSMSHPNPHPK
jgi:hypothetical protein